MSSTGQPKGEGSVGVEDGVLTLQRSNIDERYEMWLERYSYKGEDCKNTKRRFDLWKQEDPR
jgi:hypothetical protein